MDAKRNLAENLRRLRKARGMTCEEFSRELGIGKSTLYKLEHGLDNFSSTTLEQISSAVGIPPSELLAAPAPMERLSESALRMASTVACLSRVDQNRAQYHFDQLVALLQQGMDYWRKEWGEL